MTDIYSAVEAMLKDVEDTPVDYVNDVSFHSMLDLHFTKLEVLVKQKAGGVEFEELMRLWPTAGRKRTNRPRGRTALKAALKNVSPKDLKAALLSYVNSEECAKEKNQYCPGLNVWLSAEKWREYLADAQAGDRRQFQFEGVAQMWDQRVKEWTSKGFWDTDEFGPRPTHPATQVPLWLLKREDIQTDTLNG